MQTDVSHRAGADSNDAALKTPQARLKDVLELMRSAKDQKLGVGFAQQADGTSILTFKSPFSREVVSVPSKVAQEGFEGLMKGILPVKETQLILFELAKAYSKDWPILLEGGTAIGKTFAINLFCKLIYGTQSEIVDFYCNGQTDVSEIMGKFRPANVSDVEMSRINSFLNSDGGAALKVELVKETGGTYTVKELVDRAALKLGIPVSRGSFTWEDGRLPYAMKKGLPLHIQELGMAPVSVTNVFLKMRGDAGKIGSQIQMAEHAGELVTAAPGFFMFFSTNPPGKEYQERSVVDPALVRALYTVRLPDRLSDESIREASERLFSPEYMQSPARGTILDLRKHPEVSVQVSRVVASFFLQYRDKISSPEVGRRQRVYATLDQMHRIAELCQTQQVPTEDEACVDMVETVRQAVHGVLIGQLEDKPSPFGAASVEKADKENKSVGKALMSGFEHLLGADVDPVDFRGRATGRGEVIEILTREAWESYLPDVDSTLSRDAENRARTTHYLRESVDKLMEIRAQAGSDADIIFEATINTFPPDQADELKRMIQEREAALRS